jgi:hypothetical protein
VAQQHLDPTDPTAGPVTGDALAGYLRAQATEFLRALRLHRETGGASGNGTEDSVDAARALRRSVRRISGSLHTFRPLLEADWSEGLRPELAWLSGTLSMEHAYAARLERLLLALHRLSGATVFPAQAAGMTAQQNAGPPIAQSATDRGNLTVGAAKAGALLERQLTLARTRSHSTALQALGSSRFHAVADKVAVLASEVPLTATAPTADLRTLAGAAEERLTDAVTLQRGGPDPRPLPGPGSAPPGRPLAPGPPAAAPAPLRPRGHLRHGRPGRRPPADRGPGPRPPPRRLGSGDRGGRGGPHPAYRPGDGIRARGAPRGPAARGGGGPLRLPAVLGETGGEHALSRRPRRP